MKIEVAAGDPSQKRFRVKFTAGGLSLECQWPLDFRLQTERDAEIEERTEALRGPIVPIVTD